jgi:hypothetical protein
MSESSSVRYSLISLALGCFGAFVLLTLLAAGDWTKFEDIGLGINTSGLFLKHDAKTIHCVYVSTGQDCIEDARATGAPVTVLWLGASQLHGINAPKEDDKTAPWLVHDAMLKEGASVVTFSQPNANFQEHIVIFEELLSRMKIDALILGAVFDDMKEVGVRDEIRDGLDVPAVRSRLETTAFGRRLVATFGRLKSDDKPAEPARAVEAAPAPPASSRPEAETTTPQREPSTAVLSTAEPASQPQAPAAPVPEHKPLQQQVEAVLETWMANHLQLWEERGELRGRLVQVAHAARRRALELRNVLLRIDSTKWMIKVEGAQYDLNFAAFQDLLERAQSYRIPVLVYIAPRPTNAHFPYDLSHYERFKTDIKAVADGHGARLVNLEDSAPGDVWGQIDNGVGVLVTDVFHFTARGHARLAKGINPAVKQLIESSARPAQQ